jgi:hypothetical protein
MLSLFYSYAMPALAAELSELAGTWNNDRTSENLEIIPDQNGAFGTVKDDRFGRGRISITDFQGADFVISYGTGERCYFQATLVPPDRLRLANRTGPNASPNCLFGQFTLVSPAQPPAEPNDVGNEGICKGICDPDEVAVHAHLGGNDLLERGGYTCLPPGTCGPCYSYYAGNCYIGLYAHQYYGF